MFDQGHELRTESTEDISAESYLASSNLKTHGTYAHFFNTLS